MTRRERPEVKPSMRTKLLFAALLIAAVLVAPAAAAQTTVSTASNSEARVTPGVYRAETTYTMTVNFTNLDGTQSVEKVCLNISTGFYSSIEVVSALVYNETGGDAGSWSYSFDPDTGSGCFYTSGSNPLQQNWVLSITFSVTTSATAGTYQISLIAYHSTGPGEYVEHSRHSLSVMIDAAPPTMTIEEPQPYMGKYYVRVVNDEAYVIIRVTDTIDGSTQLNLNEYPVDIADLTAKLNNVTDATASAEVIESGTYYQLVNISINLAGLAYTDGDNITVSFTLVDTAENIAKYSFNLTIDNTAPEITVTGVYRDEGFTDALYNPDGVWIANANDEIVYLVFTAADNLALKSVTAHIGEQHLTVMEHDGLYYVEVNVSGLGDGESLEVTIEASDAAGNTASRSITITRDTQPPTVYINGTEIPSEVQCFVKNTTIVLTATDTVSGFSNATVYVYKYLHQGDTDSLVETEEIEWTGSGLEVDLNMTSAGQGYYFEVEIIAQDNAGNKATYHYRAVVDNSDPAITLNGIQGANKIGDVYYTNADTIGLDVSILDASTVRVEIYADSTYLASQAGIIANGESHILPVPLSTLAEGPYELDITAIDCAGNHTSLPVNIMVDRTPPELDSDTSTIDDLNGTLYTSADAQGVVGTPTAELSDALSPITTVAVYLDGSDVTSSVTVNGLGTGSVIIDFSPVAEQLFSEGSHSITIEASDAAGNTKTYTVTYTIDDTPPSLPTDFVAEAGWVNGTITLQGTVTDNFGIDAITLVVYNASTGTELASYTLVSDCGCTSYSLDGTKIQLDSIPEAWELQFEIKATDLAGNAASATDPDTVMIDRTPPTVTITLPGEYVDSHSFNITVEVSDTYSGAAPTLELTLDGDASYSIVDTSCSGGSCTFTVEINVAADGVYVITAAGYDQVGNKAGETVQVVVDTMPPVVEYTAANVTGGLLITDLNIDDANLAYAKIKIYIDDADEPNLTIDIMPEQLEQLKTGYWLVTATKGTAEFFQATSWADFVEALGDLYRQAVESKGVFAAVFDGKILVFGGARTEPATIKVEICAKDLAGQKSGMSNVFAMSTADGVFPVKLYEGWNLVSLPVVASINASEIQDIIVGDASVEAVYIYRNGSWMVYIPGVTGDFEISSKDAVWVKISGEGYMLAQGKLPYLDAGNGAPPSVVVYELQAGGNFVGFTSPAAIWVSVYFDSIKPYAYELVYVYDSEARLWRTTMIYYDIPLLPGMGIWVYLYSDATLVVPVWYSS